MDENQHHIHAWVERTLTRLREIEASQEDARAKRLRASVNVCFLLQEMATTYLPRETQAGIHHLVVLYLKLEQ